MSQPRLTIGALGTHTSTNVPTIRYYEEIGLLPIAYCLLPAALSLMIFVWLLTLHPAASGRVYATYGAIYIATALGWLWLVDGVSPTWTDVAGVALALCGAGVIAMGQRSV